MVASRLPVDRTENSDGEASWRPSPGGLVTALEPVMRSSGGVWLGWSGDAGPAPGPFKAGGLHLVGIGLSADQIRDYYEGFCNATLWPLYHDVIAPPRFHRRWWDAYVAVNRYFAEEADRQAGPGATVWVHDYQLQLVPQMNLVAKEYVACRDDESGALVLSEFAGAADELSGAFLVNPHDIEGLKDAIVRAARITPQEARRRMRAMRRRVRDHDVAHWAASFLDMLARDIPGLPGRRIKSRAPGKSFTSSRNGGERHGFHGQAPQPVQDEPGQGQAGRGQGDRRSVP